MINNKQIFLEQLQAVTNDTFDFVINTLGKKSISLDKSLFWNIDTVAKYDPTTTPTENQIGLGDLFDDLAEIEKTAADNEYISSLTFANLAKIFQYLAESDEWYK